MTRRKHAVETTEMLDFLKEIVQGVPDPSAGGTVDLDGENAEGAKKKRGKGKKSGAATAGGETGPRKKRKRKHDVAQAEGETEGKSEPERDTAMDEDEEERGPLYSGSSYKAEAEDWRTADEDTLTPSR